MAEAGEDGDSEHANAGGGEGEPELEADPAGQQAPKQLLQEDVGGQEEGDGDRGEEEAVGPCRLGRRAHEGLVVEADEEADSEEGEEAAVEHLRDQDHVHARR